jgi:hypothetical protein
MVDRHMLPLKGADNLPRERRVVFDQQYPNALNHDASLDTKADGKLAQERLSRQFDDSLGA